MRTSRLLVASLALAVLSGAGSARALAAGQDSKVFQRNVVRTLRANYWLFLPANYEPAGEKRWPLLLFLHGAGERGTDLEKVKVHGPPKLVQSRPDFPFVLASPQCPDDERWSNDVLLGLLDEVIAQNRIDTNRVYLTGLSMGGFGTWSLAIQHPGRFAAVAPICGGGEVIDILLANPARTAALKKLRVWAFHGAKDPVVQLEESERMIRALRKIGVNDVELTIYPEAQHDSWTEAYQNPKLYEWFLRHERRPQ